MSHKFRVILLIETSRGAGRALLRGVLQYTRYHGPWAFFREHGDLDKTLPRLKHWKPDGIIMRDYRKNEEILGMRLPTVINVHFESTLAPATPKILTDDENIGRMGAAHLLDRGYRNLAFVGYDEYVWSHQREESFCRSAAEVGGEVRSYRQPKSGTRRLWENEQTFMADFIKYLPQPLGIMAVNDDRALHVLEACKLANLQVPRDVSVIGVDNDAMVCDLADPPLSSVAMNFERAGYEAAELLDHLMRGEKMADQVITVCPTHIVTRQSTDILAISDPEVALAVHFIQSNYSRCLQVSDVVTEIAVSRSKLEKKFRKLVGRSPLEEIRRVRVEKIAQMLVETNLPIAHIATALDLPGVAHLARYFCREKHMSPLEYRRRFGMK